ncbi:unnamed protein product [Amoebophrya sp. A120]|nr:unnamed protein product [Amoebophrya sp. A120]|eukprot:GSA120T00000917001.1
MTTSNSRAVSTGASRPTTANYKSSSSQHAINRSPPPPRVGLLFSARGGGVKTTTSGGLLPKTTATSSNTNTTNRNISSPVDIRRGPEQLVTTSSGQCIAASNKAAAFGGTSSSPTSSRTGKATKRAVLVKTTSPRQPPASARGLCPSSVRSSLSARRTTATSSKAAATAAQHTISGVVTSTTLSSSSCSSSTGAAKNSSLHQSGSPTFIRTGSPVLVARNFSSSRPTSTGSGKIQQNFHAAGPRVSTVTTPLKTTTTRTTLSSSRQSPRGSCARTFVSSSAHCSPVLLGRNRAANNTSANKTKNLVKSNTSSPATTESSSQETQELAGPQTIEQKDLQLLPDHCATTTISSARNYSTATTSVAPAVFNTKKQQEPQQNINSFQPFQPTNIISTTTAFQFSSPRQTRSPLLEQRKLRPLVVPLSSSSIPCSANVVQLSSNCTSANTSRAQSPVLVAAGTQLLGAAPSSSRNNSRTATPLLNKATGASPIMDRGSYTTGHKSTTAPSTAGVVRGNHGTPLDKHRSGQENNNNGMNNFGTLPTPARQAVASPGSSANGSTTSGHKAGTTSSRHMNYNSHRSVVSAGDHHHHFQGGGFNHNHHLAQHTSGSGSLTGNSHSLSQHQQMQHADNRISTTVHNPPGSSSATAAQDHHRMPPGLSLSNGGGGGGTSGGEGPNMLTSITTSGAAVASTSNAGAPPRQLLQQSANTTSNTSARTQQQQHGAAMGMSNGATGGGAHQTQMNMMTPRYNYNLIGGNQHQADHLNSTHSSPLQQQQQQLLLSDQLYSSTPSPQLSGYTQHMLSTQQHVSSSITTATTAAPMVAAQGGGGGSAGQHHMQGHGGHQHNQLQQQMSTSMNNNGSSSTGATSATGQQGQVVTYANLVEMGITSAQQQHAMPPNFVGPNHTNASSSPLVRQLHANCNTPVMNNGTPKQQESSHQFDATSNTTTSGNVRGQSGRPAVGGQQQQQVQHQQARLMYNNSNSSNTTYNHTIHQPAGNNMNSHRSSAMYNNHDGHHQYSSGGPPFVQHGGGHLYSAGSTTGVAGAGTSTTATHNMSKTMSAPLGQHQQPMHLGTNHMGTGGGGTTTGMQLHHQHQMQSAAPNANGIMTSNYSSSTTGNTSNTSMMQEQQHQHQYSSNLQHGTSNTNMNLGGTTSSNQQNLQNGSSFLSANSLQRLENEAMQREQQQNGSGSLYNTLSMVQQQFQQNQKPGKFHRVLKPRDLIYHGVIGRGSYGKVFVCQVKNPDSLQLGPGKSGSKRDQWTSGTGGAQQQHGGGSNSVSKLYAVKVLSKNNVIQRRQVEHTRTERNVLELISHPFIIKLHHAFQTKRKLYTVMEYCCGGELFYHLTRAKKFGQEKCKFYSGEILLALHYLHSLNIIYRDLKPENVLLDGEGHVKLTDFGLSKEGVPDNYSAKSMCGTPEYLAPEILNKLGHGKAVDWYSLGALMYEMLTGLPPFYSKDRKALFENIRTAPLIVPDYISPMAQDILRKLLNRDTSRRLGASQRDGMEVMEHMFFDGMDWRAVLQRRIMPPFAPQIQLEHALDMRFFDEEFVRMDPNNSDSDSEDNGTTFQGYEYTPKLDSPRSAEQSHHFPSCMDRHGNMTSRDVQPMVLEAHGSDDHLHYGDH